MGLIAEWNRTDLSQFVSGGSPDFNEGGGAPTLSVVNVPERGNVIRYAPGGGAEVRQIFMFSEASGLLVPSDSERRDIEIEIEYYTVNGGAGGSTGVFVLGDADTPLHGFGHSGGGQAERQFLLNNGVTTVSGTGSSVDRLAHYWIRGRKPAGAPPEVSSYVRGWVATGGSGGEPRRSGSDATARGSVNPFGNNDALGATWNDLDCNRIGLCFQSSAGNPGPTTVDILNVRVFDPLTAPPPALDTTPPVIQNFSPTPGTTLNPVDAVEFDITDDSGTFARNIIAVAFEDGIQELAYDGDAFTARYLGSTIAATSVGGDPGFHYTLRRTGGWRGSTITVRAFAVDSGGNREA